MATVRSTPLARQLLVPFLGLGLWLVGLVLFAGWQQMNRQLDSQLEERARTVARALRFAAESADSRESLSRLTHVFVAGGDVDLVAISGGHPERIMVASDSRMQGVPVARLPKGGIAAGVAAALAGENAGEYRQHDRAQGRYVFAARLNPTVPATHPLANGGVLLELPTRALQAQINASALWMLAGLMILGAVGAGGFAWLLRARVLRPLATLADQAGTGGTVAAPEDAAREIGVLAGSLNRALAEVAALNRDLEQRVRARTDELAASLEREREAGRLKVNFLGMISHEFRNTLGLVLSSTQILTRYGARLDDAERARHLAKIEASCRRLAGVVEDTLFYSRSEGGRLELHLAPVDLGAFCLAEIQAQEPTAGPSVAARIRFVSEPGAPTEVTTDESLLRHVLANLLANALKYSDPAAPVTLALAAAGPGTFTLSVQDEGIGIPADEQAKIGEPFWRGRNAGHVPGTGLGLVIVQRCLSLLGGTLRCDSRPGGTRFTLTLPRHVPVA